MGYNENQYSLTRWIDLLVSRAGMFDDTYYTPNTAGWMFVPIEPYHAGGGSASFAPLGEHLQEFEWALAQYLLHRSSLFFCHSSDSHPQRGCSSG
jgi:hypothetical protein